MPTVTLSDATYSKLQKVAKPFIDTEDSACERVLDFYLQRNSVNGDATLMVNGNGALAAEAIRLDPETHQLAHTRLLSATVDCNQLHRPKWNALMHQMHIMARKRLGTFEAVRKESQANLRQGRYEENGYKYIPEADLSIQGVDANHAWEHSLRLAKAMNVSLEATFEWRDKEEAAHPGQKGIIEWYPDNH